jgi:hypothetical protein
LVPSFAEHPIISHDCRLARLRRLYAAIPDTSLERSKSLEIGQADAVAVALDQMNEGPVSKLESHVAKTLRRLRRQLAENIFDKQFVFFGSPRLGFVADQRPFHLMLPWLLHGFAAVRARNPGQCASGFAGTCIPKTFRGSRRIRGRARKIPETSDRFSFVSAWSLKIPGLVVTTRS